MSDTQRTYQTLAEIAVRLDSAGQHGVAAELKANPHFTQEAEELDAEKKGKKSDPTVRPGEAAHTAQGRSSQDKPRER